MPFRIVTLIVILLSAVPAHADTGAHPCTYTDIHPTYPAVSAPPEVLATDNTPPPGGATCFPEQKDAAIWITVASVLPISASPADFIKRFGAISALTDIQYWSTTDQAWRPMVSAASAVDSTQSHQPRADYSATDLPGPAHYYQVTDTRTYSPVTYSLELHSGSKTHLVLETANLDPIKKWGITLYKPDGIHTLYLLEERTPGTWSYYSITRIIPATFLAKGNKNSYINRAVALYRHYMDLPTTAEPPAAR